MFERICIVNQKGGVAKTTTAANLACLLSESGRRVLAIDLDQQGSLGRVLGVPEPEEGRTVYEVIMGDIDVEEAIVSTPCGVDLLPADMMLARGERDFGALTGREVRIRKPLNRLKGSYDYVILDCPPSLGDVVVMALTASDHVIIPLAGSELALRGVRQLKETIDLVRDYTNAKLSVAGIVLCLWDAHLKVSSEVRAVAQEAADVLGGRLFQQAVRRAPAEDARALAAGLPAVAFEPRSKIAGDYRALLPEVLEALGGGAR